MLQAKQLSRLTELEASGPALKATFCESSRKILKDAFPIKKDALPLGRTPPNAFQHAAFKRPLQRSTVLLIFFLIVFIVLWTFISSIFFLESIQCDFALRSAAIA